MQIKITFLTFLILSIHTYVYSATLFTPRLTLTEEYTDNLDLVPDDDPYNEKKADWITTISPGASFEVAGRTSGIMFDYEPSVVMYRHYNEYDTLRHRGAINFWADLSRRTIFEFENVSTYTEDPISEHDTTVGTGHDTTVRTGRYHYFMNIASTTLAYQFGPQDSLNLGYIYEFLENEETDIENEYVDLQDTQRHETYLRLTYWPFENEWGTETDVRYSKRFYQESDLFFETTDDFDEPLADFDFWTAGLRLIRRFDQRIDGSLRYIYSNMNFDDSGDVEGPRDEDEDYQLHMIGPGLHYIIGENTDLSVECMYFLRDLEESHDESGFIFVSELFQRWTFSRSYIELTASSGYQPDTFGAESNGFDIFAEIDAIYEHSFSRQTRWDIFGSARYDQYIDQDPERVDNTFRAGTGLSHRIFSWATLRLEYRYRQVLSENYDFEYIENRGMISLTMMPLREQGTLRDRRHSDSSLHDREDQSMEEEVTDEELEDSDENSSDHRQFPF
jgi:hypothetical protein